MSKAEIKKRIRHCKAELNDAYKNLKRMGVKNPAQYIGNGCDGYEKEWEISYASHMLGEIAVLERLID